ncbi:MAG: Mur ligase family protein [Patescibacteria group bacterium]
MKTTFKKIITYILQIESILVLYKYKPKIIAITGSIGKTSTKDAVYAVLSGISYVRKSEKSFNSEIGLPLTILGIPNGWSSPSVWFANILKGLWLIIYPHKYPTWLVLEVGVGKPGDMQKTALWLKTDAVIITAIGETPAHIEFFKSRRHLIEEKSQLISTLKNTGLLILNADDEDVLKMKTKTKMRTLMYGFKNDADVVASSDTILYDDKGVPQGMRFRIDEGGNSFPVTIEGVFGRNHLYASLCAVTLSFGLKLNTLHTINSLLKYEVPPGRMRLLSGISDSIIIDDTYNSSPFALQSAIKTLGEIKNLGRKVAILGDMLELGRHTVEAHKNIGKFLKEYVDVLIVVGHRALDIKEGAMENGMNDENIYEFLNAHDAAIFIKDFIKTNDIVLVKGSQGMRMERAVEAILLDQENKDSLLVRQDIEWKKKL